MDYTQKYIKYKEKYLQLKNNIRGGCILDDLRKIFRIKGRGPNDAVNDAVHSLTECNNGTLNVDNNAGTYSLDVIDPIKIQIHSGNTSIAIDEEYYDGITLNENKNKCKRFIKVDSKCESAFSTKLPYTIYTDNDFDNKCEKIKRAPTATAATATATAPTATAPTATAEEARETHSEA